MKTDDNKSNHIKFDEKLFLEVAKKYDIKITDEKDGEGGIYIGGIKQSDKDIEELFFSFVPTQKKTNLIIKALSSVKHHIFLWFDHEIYWRYFLFKNRKNKLR